jgi:hypothetical protein
MEANLRCTFCLSQCTSKGPGGRAALSRPLFVVTEHLGRDPYLMFLRAFFPAGARALFRLSRAGLCAEAIGPPQFCELTLQSHLSHLLGGPIKGANSRLREALPCAGPFASDPLKLSVIGLKSSAGIARNH